MALQELQWQIRGLVLGPETPYWPTGANPFALTVRADQGGPRAWAHGSWSGAEWANEKVVPMRVWVLTDSAAAWVTAHQNLAAAFAPVGDVAEQVELRWRRGGQEFILFGRPRMVDPDPSLIGGGVSLTRCEFVAQDPRVYAGTEIITGPVSLPTFAGGLIVPFVVPFTVNSTLIGGRAELVNEGTAPTGLFLRIDGPVPQPRIILQRPDGTNQSITFNPDFDLPAGQWIDIDVAARIALLNGLPRASVRGQAVWDMDPYPLLPGTTTLRFMSSDEAAGTVTTRHRSAWW